MELQSHDDPLVFSCEYFHSIHSLLQFVALPCQCPAQGILRRLAICFECDFSRCRCTKLLSCNKSFALGYRRQVVRRNINHCALKNIFVNRYSVFSIRNKWLWRPQTSLLAYSHNRLGFQSCPTFGRRENDCCSRFLQGWC